MRDALYHLEHSEAATLQARIRETILAAVNSRQIGPGDLVPSTRAMARRLNVSRNTVTLAYHALVADGFLGSRERSGFFVSEDAIDNFVTPQKKGKAEPVKKVDWEKRFQVRPLLQRNIDKRADWREFPFPFLYGQADADLFPIAEWRDCMRQAMGRRWLDSWTEDRISRDDPMLVEQICKRILPRRGIMANENQILVTLGAQNALYLIAALLGSKDAKVAVENPGYPDIRNYLELSGTQVLPMPIDDDGLIVSDTLKEADLAFVTPSHQFPTTVTMSLERRRELLKYADAHDIILIEDDYEFETNYLSEPCPALKSLDQSDHVLYVGSLSKSLVPGLRVGFIVGDEKFIREARAMRRLMYRHPPGNNQRAVALFLAEGHHDTLVHRLHRVYRERWQIMGDSLNSYFPNWSSGPGFGGTSYWVEGPEALKVADLEAKCEERGVLIEPGDVYFASETPPTNYFRLGFSAISAERIEPGIAKLAEAVELVL